MLQMENDIDFTGFPYMKLHLLSFTVLCVVFVAAAAVIAVAAAVFVVVVVNRNLSIY
jgi:hypothetical protein